MSGDLEERMGQLCDELQQALDAGQSIDTGKLAERFAIPEPDVHKALQALQAMQDVLGEDVASHAQELTPPQLSDDYEVLDELGRGGMGVVYRAHQKSLDRDLAVKVLRPGDLLFGDAIRRFEREAKSLAKLRHRHIVSVHEVGKTDGFVYFTMDLIDGCTLAERLENGAMPTTQAVKLLLQVSSAMAYAHGKGVMHRDLKPGNILLDPSGDGFVCDFGLARELGGEAGATMTGQMLGTPAYMAPEQALGDRDKIGEQTDVYALGAILYECLAGKAPFAGLPLAQLMHAVIEKQPTPLRKRNGRVPFDLQVIVEKAMAKDPEQRYATVQAFAEDLERFSIGRPILARSASTLEQGWRALRRNRRGVARTLVPVAVLLTLAWLFVLPSVMRGRTVALAERMRASGSTQGEVAAYEDLYDGVAPGSIASPDRARYLRACYDEAARLWVHGREEEQDRANELFARAVELLGELDHRNHGRQTEGLSPEAREALRLEHTRLLPLLPYGHNGLSQLGQERVHSTLLSATHPSSTASNLILAAGSIPQGWNNAPWSPPQRAGVVALLPQCARLPSLLRDHLLRTCRSAFSTPCAYVDMQFLAQLVEITKDTSLHYEARENAAALFHATRWMPFLTQSRDDPAHGRGSLLAASEQDLAWLGATWDRLASLPRIEQYSARIQAVAERYAEGKRTGRLGRLEEHDLQFWLRRHTGDSTIDDDDLERLCRPNRDTDPRDVLLQSMHWHVAADEVTIDELVERLAGRHRTQAHHLLELTVTDGVPVPADRVHTEYRTRPLWLRALHRTGPYDRRLRVAAFEIPDGHALPRIFHRQQHVVTIDQPTEWRIPLPSRRPFPTAWLGEAMVRWDDSSMPRVPTGRATLRMNGSKLELQSVHLQHPVMPFGVWARDYYDADHEVDDGVVAFLGGANLISAGGSAGYTWFALGVTEPLDAPDSAWTVERWRTAIAASVQRMSQDRYRAINNAKHIAAASFLPTVIEPKTWADLKAQFDIQNDDYCQLHRRAARLLSGDESAIAADTSTIGDGHGREFLDAQFYVRLAGTTGSDAIRAHAFERLQQVELTPDLRRKLANQRDQLGTVPDPLAAELVDVPSPRMALLQTMWTGILLLVAHVVLLVWALVRMLRAGTGGRAAALLAIGLALLWNNWGIWLDGVELNPRWLGHALATLSVWALCWRSTHGPGWLVVAMLWTGTSVAYATGYLDHPVPIWILAAIALLSLPMHRDYIDLSAKPSPAAT